MATKPDAVVLICPCGTAYSFFTMPYLNMVVASDPESSWQVRLKGKTLKALLGDGVAYFGDFVELSDRRRGFRLDARSRRRRGHQLRVAGRAGQEGQEAPAHTRAGEGVGLLGQALPAEAALPGRVPRRPSTTSASTSPRRTPIRKGDALYYAFFADGFRGKVELRGLESRRYRVRDYETGRDFGSISGPRAPLEASFKGHLLLEALPE